MLPAILKTAESHNNRTANMTVQTAFYITTMLTTLKNSGKLKTINRIRSVIWEASDVCCHSGAGEV